MPRLAYYRLATPRTDRRTLRRLSTNPASFPARDLAGTALGTGRYGQAGGWAVLWSIALH